MISTSFIFIWLGWLLLAGSPGPATLGIIATAMGHGRRAGLTFALGILAGSACWGLAATLGLSALLIANPWLLEILRYAGALYLGYLALHAFYIAWRGDHAQSVAPTKSAGLTLFSKGAAIHLTNPKAVLGWGAVFATIAPPNASITTLLGYFAILYAGSVLIFIGYALLFSSQRAVMIYARLKRWFNLAFGVFFALASVKILTARLI